MPAIITLVENLKKYAEYLTTTAINITQHHHRDESTHSSENNCIIYQVDACKHDNLKDDYVQLNNFLSENTFYNYINVQQYLLLDIMKQYRFIKELQLTFPIGIYRLVFICIIICL